MRPTRLLVAGLVLFVAGPTLGQWSTLDLPHPRLAPAGTALGTKALFGGGNPGPSVSSETDIVDIYDDVTATWTTAQLSVARVTIEAVSVGSKALFAGGWDGSFLDVVDIFDDATNSWSTHSLAQYGWVQAAVVGSQVFFAGGHIANTLGSPYTSIVSVYDSSSDAWSTLHLSAARGELGVASVGSKVLFAGGLGQTGISSTIDIYDAQTGVWTTANLSLPRAVMGAVTVGSKVLFAGGFGLQGQTSTEVTRVDIYDDATGTWSTAELSEPRQSPAVATVGPLALFAGGQRGAGTVSDVVDIYDSRSGQWSITHLSQERAQAGVAVLCNRVLFAGGGTTNAQDNVVIDVFTLPTALGQSFCQPAVRNSTGMPGLLCANGAASASTGQVTLVAKDLPVKQFGLFIVAPQTASLPNFGGSAGTLCLGGGLGFYRAPGEVQSVSTAGTIELTVDPGQTPTPTGFVGIAAGETWHFQCWYRDLGNTTNFSDALSITFQ